MRKDKSKSSEKRKKSFLNPFRSVYTDGPGVEKDDEPPILDNPGIANFFKHLGRSFNKLLSVNLLMVFGNFPVLFLLIAISGIGGLHSTAPSYSAFAPLYGASLFGNSPAISAALTLLSRQADITLPTVFTYVMYGLSALTVITFGLVNVGTTYILRNMLRGEPVFLWTDFKYAIKRNWKQGIIFGVIDLVMMFMLVYDLIFFRLNINSNSVTGVMYFMSFAMIIVYFFMRMYTYLMMVTFDLSLWKLIKNSVFFAALGIKRNIMALLGVITAVAVNYFILNLYMPVGMILPFVITFALIQFITVYAAYPKIKEIMIDGYDSDEANETEAE